MDASINALDTSIDNINSSIRDISTRIHDLRNSLDAIICSFEDILRWINKKDLVPNKFYLINDYYVGDGCMALPSPSTNFSGPTSGNSLNLLVKANDASTLDGKLYEVYDHSGNALKVYGTYIINKSNKTVKITWLKDKYGNEAPYDFYNLKYNKKFTFNMGGDASNLLLITNTVKNNIIKSDPYDINK